MNKLHVEKIQAKHVRTELFDFGVNNLDREILLVED